jgi:hypothetical protein
MDVTVHVEFWYCNCVLQANGNHFTSICQLDQTLNVSEDLKVGSGCAIDIAYAAMTHRIHHSTTQCKDNVVQLEI